MTHTPAPATAPAAAGGGTPSKPWWRQLYVQVLVAIVIGIFLGWRWPDLASSMEPIGTTFIAAMKMLIGPIVFLTIIGGVAGVADLKKVGLTGIKALTYFQLGTIVALLTGLVAINVFRLGDGVHADPSAIATSGPADAYIESGEHQRWWEFLTNLVPHSFFGAFVEGDILQVIFLAVIFGIALKSVGKVGEPIIASVNRLTEVVFKVLAFVMKAAPLGAFGVMSYAIGMFGLSTLTSLGSLILLFYVTSILFVVVGLGAVLAAFVKLNIFQLFRYFKEEFFLILGTSTAEPALPGLMRKLQFMGVEKSTVGLVVPTGYSFNLDGAAIYLSLATLYIAQATDTDTLRGQVGELSRRGACPRGARQARHTRSGSRRGRARRRRSRRLKRAGGDTRRRAGHRRRGSGRAPGGGAAMTSVEPVTAALGMRDNTVPIEAAQICGLGVLPHGRKAPLTTTSYGLGEAVRHADTPSRASGSPVPRHHRSPAAARRTCPRVAAVGSIGCACRSWIRRRRCHGHQAA
ncbi:cation:dicarboxylase symporter family transporter [Streptomyces scopuliridis]|uniref:cation:dicarboxylate symporter family transporter n=1 Tax=Streptomyces scopuliridis TaxID=452529 RepID=UPI002DDB5308|nr:cation:dicarboxylase symporter family transporter [Streptomyces scopuliridis]WSB31914.1 cation:dicarboxylase symporter family transporter [Streptomyces scopuliridis]